MLHHGDVEMVGHDPSVPRPPDPGRLGGVILAGGGGARLGGVDKARLRYAGQPLLDRALEALAGLEHVVVVADPSPAPRWVRFVREQPPGGGPASGLLAGRAAMPEAVDRLVVLAVDMPHVTAVTVQRLSRAALGHDGAFLVDASGRRALAGVLATSGLDRVTPPPSSRSGLPLHRLLAGLDLADVPAQGREAHDVDTPEDLREGPPETDGPVRP